MKGPLSAYASAMLRSTTTASGQSTLPGWLLTPLAMLAGQDVAMPGSTSWADERLLRKAIALFQAASSRRSGKGAAAWQFSSDGRQAIQVLPQVSDRDQQRAFNELSRRLESITMNHPRLAPILEAAVQQGYPYLAARIGEGFQALTRRFGLPLPPQQAMQIAAQVSSALEYAHYRGVIHGAFDLTDVLVNEQGQASLLGVGVEQLRHRLGASGVGILSPLLPPEVESGQQPADVRADVYAMGALLYVLLTGRVPSSGQQVQLAETLPDVSAALDALMTRALATNPQDRYPSLNELNRDLRLAQRTPRAAPRPALQRRVQPPPVSRTPSSGRAGDGAATPSRAPATTPDGFPEPMPMPEIDFSALEQVLEMPQIAEWVQIEIPPAPEIPQIDWAELLQPVDLSEWAGVTISLPYEAVTTLETDPLVAAAMAVKATEQTQQSRQRPARRPAEFTAPQPAPKDQPAAKPRRVRRP